MNNDLFTIAMVRILQIVTSLFSVRITTHIIEPSEMGKIALITSIYSIFALVFINPLGMYINRYLNEWYKAGILGYRIRTSWYYFMGISFVVFILVAVLQPYIDIDVTWGWTIFLIVGMFTTSTINQSVISYINMLGHRLAWAIFTLLTIWIGLIASIYCVNHYTTGAEWWITGQLIGILISSLLAILFFRKLLLNQYQVHDIEKSKAKNRKDANLIFQFCYPIILGVAFQWIQFQSPRFIIETMYGIEYLGYFIVGYGLTATIFGVFESIAINYFSPILYNKLETTSSTQRISSWNEYATMMICLTIYIAVYTGLMSKQLLHILVDKKYWGISYFLVIGSMVEAGRVIGNVYGILPHFMEKTKALIIPQLVGAIAAVILISLFAHTDYEYGLMIALLLSSLLYVISFHWLMVKLFAISLDIKKILYNIPLCVLFVIPYIISKEFPPNYLNDFVLVLFTGIIYLIISYRSLIRYMQNNPDISANSP